MKLGKQCRIVGGHYYHRDGWIIKSDYGDVVYWYSEDQRNYHRLDGPAIEGPDGDTRWIIEGVEYFTEPEYERAVCEYKARKAKQTNGTPSNIVGIKGKA